MASTSTTATPPKSEIREQNRGLPLTQETPPQTPASASVPSLSQARRTIEDNWYRLLHGLHHEGGVTYRTGAVFRSKSDLLRLNGVKVMPKFEKLPIHHPLVLEKLASVAEETGKPLANEEEILLAKLQPLSLKQLQGYCAVEEIDDCGAHSKDELIRVILAASEARRSR